MSPFFTLAVAWLGALAQPETAVKTGSAAPPTTGPATPPIPSPGALLRPHFSPAPGLGSAPPATSPSLTAAPAPIAAPRPAPSFVVPRRVTRTTEPRLRLPRGWAIDMSGGTSAPIAVGAALQAETPQRILAQLEIGGLVGRYVDVVDIVAARARHDPRAAGLVRDATRNALVIRAALGVRPLRKRGLEIRGGYTVVTHGHSTASLGTIGDLADITFVDDSRIIPVRATVHSIHADLGWRWVIREHILVRTALGYLHSLGAQMFAAETWTTDAELIGRTDEALAVLADQAAMTALRSPVLTLHLGYRF